MRLNIVVSSCVALVLLGVVVHDAAAHTVPSDGESDEARSYSWGLGVAGMAMQKSYAGIDRDYMPIPVIYFENRWVQLIGPVLEFKLPGFSRGEEGSLSFGARFEYDGNGYKQSEAPILHGMADRKSGILAGLSAKWDGSLLSASAEAMFDATNHSKGRRFSFGIERTFFAGERVMITPSVTAIRLDKTYANYYYGVLPGEARAGRVAYAPGGTLNTSLGVRVDYMLGSRHLVFLQVDYTALGSEIKRGPLVDRAGESMLDVGYMFRF